MMNSQVLLLGWALTCLFEHFVAKFLLRFRELVNSHNFVNLVGLPIWIGTYS